MPLAIILSVLALVSAWLDILLWTVTFLLLFAWLMFYVRSFNRAVARICGAPPGGSFSAHLWRLEHFGSWPMKWLGKFLRPPVDALAEVFEEQEDHCETCFVREGS